MSHGKLYIVPTPLGNLEDMTLRAIRILKAVESVLAEDTRTSKKLLNHYEIGTPLYSHHMFNEHKTLAGLISRLQAGAQLAIITDAGTPAISDPGYLLVRECIRNGIDVECLPGATAIIPAAVISGLPLDRFTFEGFLPQKKGRQKHLGSLINEQRTMVFYESPHRLLKALDQMSAVFGADRQCAVVRELTKMHEEVVRGTLAEVHAHFSATAPRGEIVMVVEGRRMSKKRDEEMDDEVSEEV